MTYRIPLNTPTVKSEETAAALDALESGDLTMGKRCAEFERGVLNEMASDRYGCFVNSGSSANLLAFFALKNPLLFEHTLRPPKLGMEVIMSAICWPTTVWAAIQAGFVPVFVDVDVHTFCMRPDRVEAAINENTLAICVTHVLGGAVDMDPIRLAANHCNLWVIEDACESFGAIYRGRKVGTLGDFATFSFYFSHQITTVEGGFIHATRINDHELLQSMRSHGWSRGLRSEDVYRVQNMGIDPRFLFISEGFNVRPTEIAAAIGLVQLRRFETLKTNRRRIESEWVNNLPDGIKPMALPPGCESSPVVFPVLCETVALKKNLQQHLEAKGIETRPVICGNILRQPALTGCKSFGDLWGADEVMARGFYWGLDPMLSDASIEYVTDILKRYG